MTRQTAGPWSLDTLVEAYKEHQRRTRGLREQTLHGYERLIRPGMVERDARSSLPLRPSGASSIFRAESQRVREQRA